MKGKETIRALAWVMSLCMILGIVPITPPEAQAADKLLSAEYTYDLTVARPEKVAY